MAGDPAAAECGHRPITVAGIRCLRAGPDYGPRLAYFHGGGYALGSPEVALPITERLAPWVEVTSVDYRLAPEHPYPAAIDDAWAVFQALKAIEPHRPLAVGGESAGGNLALSVALRAVARGLPSPSRLILLCPHLDHGGPRQPQGGAARTYPGEDLDEKGSAWFRAAYCGPGPAADPGLSPLRADPSGLPPTLVQVGTDDRLASHGIRFARTARAAGVAVTLDVWDGLWHTWHYHRGLPEADRALAEAGSFAAG
jgi:epsilon-lactone hydrolase